VTPSTLVVSHHPESLDPLSPHIITDNESQDIERRKPTLKHALKALRNAKAEVCQLVGATLDRLTWSPLSQEPKFINSDSDDEPPAGKQHQAAAGDGKKPAIAKEDPVFGVIYKNAGLELKRHIYFVNAFPTSAESDNLPCKVYNYGVNFMIKSKLFGQDKLQGIEKAFDGKWLSHWGQGVVS
jgi:hypothetical protein